MMISTELDVDVHELGQCLPTTSEMTQQAWVLVYSKPKLPSESTLRTSRLM